MPQTQYKVSPLSTNRIPSSAGVRLGSVQSQVQATIDDLTPDQQRIVFLRVANWCLENIEHLGGHVGGNASTMAG